MKSFKDFLTPGRERILQAADIHGEKLKNSRKSKQYVQGDIKQARALAIFNRGVEPTPENKEKAEFYRKQSRIWK
jgi:hypothetical protein